MRRITDHDQVFVVGGGPSLVGFDFSKLSGSHTIAVNKALLQIPDLEYFISVDFTFSRKIDRKTFKQNPSTKVFVADLSYPFLKEIDGRIVDTRFNLIYRLGDYDLIVKSRRKDGMGLSFKDFRTGKSSGFCALQLAIVLGFRRIYLLGIDLNTTPTLTHYHGGYGEPAEKFSANLREYLSYFQKGLEDIRTKSDVEIISCSKISRLNDLIPYQDI